jgi:cysteine-rich repeat protein
MRPQNTKLLLAVALAVSGCLPGVERGDDCDNAVDDDGDDLVDCADPGCAFEAVCASCGDGVVDDNEACDDGNIADDDGCSARCLLPLCPNGELDEGEDCDDGNFIAADGCSIRCKVDRCGDRVLDGDEECEDGNRTSGDGCSSTCISEAPPTCGDGTIAFDPGTFEQLEQCDDGDRRGNDGCSASCIFELCGDGIQQEGIGEECDDADPFRPPACAFCRIPRCGDFIVSGGEQCDDGAAAPGDGCNAECRTEFCGDGIVQPGLGESCDDGNANSSDGCAFCQNE